VNKLKNFLGPKILNYQVIIELLGITAGEVIKGNGNSSIFIGYGKILSGLCKISNIEYFFKMTSITLY
jgi:hypothetical protein